MHVTFHSAYPGPAILTTAQAGPIRFGLLPDTVRNRRIEDAVFTVLDCETTGLSSTNDEPTEITAIRYRNGQALECFSTLVKPSKPIPANIEHLTGISNRMVANAPSPREALERLVDFVGEHPVLVGDFIGFDIAMIRNQLDKQGLGRFKDRFRLEDTFCTRTLASKALEGKLWDFRAIEVARLLQLPALPHHRAENDVRNAATVFFALIRRLRGESEAPGTVAELQAYQGDPWEYREPRAKAG